LLNDWDQSSCISLGDEFHKEVLGSQVYTTENSAGQNKATLSIVWLAVSNHRFVSGDNVAC